MGIRQGKGKVFLYSLPSVGPGADPDVQPVNPEVTFYCHGNEQLLLGLDNAISHIAGNFGLFDKNITSAAHYAASFLGCD